MLVILKSRIQKSKAINFATIHDLQLNLQLPQYNLQSSTLNTMLVPDNYACKPDFVIQDLYLVCMYKCMLVISCSV